MVDCAEADRGTEGVSVSVKILDDTRNGLLWHSGNEGREDAKDADAAKHRVGSRHVPGHSGGGGAFSFDVLDLHPANGSLLSTDEVLTARRIEAAVIVGGFNGTTGELGICIWDGVQPITDAGQPKVVEMRPNEVDFRVPVKFSAGVIGGAPSANSRPSRFYTDGGKFCINWQDDTGQPVGVVYATHGSADESKWTAVGKLNMGPL